MTGGSTERWGLSQGAVRAVRVVMVGVLGQHGHQLPTSEDEHPVQHIPPDGAHPSLRVGVGLRGPRGRAQQLDPLRGEDRVERGGELGIPIADQELEPGDVLTNLHDQPSRPSGGRPGVAAPPFRGVTPAAQRPSPSYSLPAVQGAGSPGRTADGAVEESCGNHRGPATPVANSQLSTHDRLSGTHRVLRDPLSVGWPARRYEVARYG